jgi:hypothetical protein
MKRIVIIDEFDEKMDKSAVHLLRVMPMLTIAIAITWAVDTQVQNPDFIPGVFILALAISAGLVNPLFLMTMDRLSDRIRTW